MADRADINLREAYVDQEIYGATRSLTKDLYHYTNAESAIFGILGSGKLRLSPFDSTNDLWDSRPLYPSLTSHGGGEWDDDEWELDHSTDIWAEVDRSIRLHAKVACLTRDWALPDRVFDRDALRGWAHLSLWAHYGAAHSGVCLRFDSDRLISSFTAGLTPRSQRLHGEVKYLSTAMASSADPINVDQVREFGADAVAIAYAIANKDSLFFRKHADWANESEYRFVSLNQSALPDHFDIRSALTGVILGDAFPEGRLDALNAVLEAYPEVELMRTHFHGRILRCVSLRQGGALPIKDEGPSWDRPRRAGEFADRLEALLTAESESAALLEHARAVTLGHSALMENVVGQLTLHIRSVTARTANFHPSTSAIPETERRRAPGVPGERVHFQSGFMCVVDQGSSAQALISVALQVLDREFLRIHAKAVVEHQEPSGNRLEVRWIERQEFPIENSLEGLTKILRDLERTAKEVVGLQPS